MQTATRYHDISVGHRVHEHASKCAHLHGHNYRIHFTLSIKSMGSDGMVLDFGIIKRLFCNWLEENWDHRFLVSGEDPWAYQLKDIDSTVCVVPFTPTAENMAWYLCSFVGPDLLKKELPPEKLENVKLERVVVEETRKCSATFEVR